MLNQILNGLEPSSRCRQHGIKHVCTTLGVREAVVRMLAGLQMPDLDWWRIRLYVCGWKEWREGRMGLFFGGGKAGQWVDQA